MSFKPTSYKLMNVADGHILEDAGWTLADPASQGPSLVRAVYEQKMFSPDPALDGIYRYACWLPIKRTLKNSCAPVTYRSKGLAKHLGLDKLFITFSGWHPEIGATFRTCSFKETEAYSVCARLDAKDKVLVVQSAGNTARAFAQVCSDNNIPIVICIPFDCRYEMWFKEALNPCVKLIAAPAGCDYFDAISLGEKLCSSSRYLAEGGAKNVARRDGMGTTLLSALEAIGFIPDAYFQAVGSGTGAIAAWENNLRLIEDGRFGKYKMKIFVAQNAPFTLMYDTWKAGRRALVDLSPEEGRRQVEIILAKVLSNRKPPFSLAGGLYDAMKDSGGDAFLADNSQIRYWMAKFQELEGYDILPAPACAVQALATAIEEGKVKKGEVIMLNITGGGVEAAKERGVVIKEPDLVLSPDLPAEEVIAKVDALF